MKTLLLTNMTLRLATLTLISTLFTLHSALAQGPSKGSAPDQVVVDPQEPKRTMSVGLMGGYSMDMHGLDNTTLPGVPSCCEGYESQTGSGIVIAGLADFVISDKLDIIARLGYWSGSIDMTSEEQITVRMGNEAKTANITHTNTSDLSMLLIEPGVEFRVAGGLGLIGGPRVGMLMSSTYSQKETLDPTIPYDYQIEATGVRNESSGDILETSSMQFGIFIGARYHLALNARKTIELVPEIQYAPMFTSILTNDSWSVSSLRFMIGVTYSFFSNVDANPLAPR